MAQQSGPWSSHLTLDLLVKVANYTFVHPFVAWMIPLCLRAQEYPWDCLSMRASLSYASILTLLSILSVINEKIAYGTPRDVDLEEEVIVITGGASGLGLLIAEVYGMRGANVAVLDVKKVENAEEIGVTSYVCDVGNAEEVAKVAEQINADLGSPTILINNAGIVNGVPLLSQTIPQIQNSLSVNLLAHFYAIKTYVPGMIAAKRGTIVTVGSVLGITGAAQLTDYAAAKAGLIALHTSLTAELRVHTFIKTVLVTPGQLNTPLFEGVKTPSSFFAPIVEPVDVAKDIIARIDAGESGVLAMPLYARWAGWLNVLPVGVQRIARWASGVDVGMRTFKKTKKQ